MAENVKYTGDPHVGLKARDFTLPLSPTKSQCFASPVSVASTRCGNVMYDHIWCRMPAENHGTCSRLTQSARLKFHIGSYRKRIRQCMNFPCCFSVS